VIEKTAALVNDSFHICYATFKPEELEFASLVLDERTKEGLCDGLLERKGGC
jgi:hypothetical protein